MIKIEVLGYIYFSTTYKKGGKELETMALFRSLWAEPQAREAAALGENRVLYPVTQEGGQGKAQALGVGLAMSGPAQSSAEVGPGVKVKV